MTLPGLLARSLKRYFKASTLIVLCAALTTGLLAGALFLGDSVRYTLAAIQREKTGAARWMLSTANGAFDVASPAAGRGFDARLAELAERETVSALELHAVSLTDAEGESLSRFRLLAVDDSFFELWDGVAGLRRIVTPQFIRTASHSGRILVNRVLADQLGVVAGDRVYAEVLPFSRLAPALAFARTESNNGASFVVDAVMDNRGPGRFSPRLLQSAEPVAYVSLSDGESLFGASGLRNLLLVVDGDGNGSGDEPDWNGVFRRAWSFEDLGLRLVRGADGVRLVSDGLFLPERLVDACLAADPTASPEFGYFVNSVMIADRVSPFAFAAASAPGRDSGLPLPSPGEVVLSDWLANDLGAAPGDTVRVAYFTAGADGVLREEARDFRVSFVRPQSAFASLAAAIPDFPGLSGAASCSAWDPSAPLDLALVRPVDEAFWTRWGPTPKMLFAYEDAAELWGTSEAIATSVRFPSEWEEVGLEASILERLEPALWSYSMTDLEARNSGSGSGMVDFGQLFLGLSIFLMASALLLLGMVLRFSLEARRGETALYGALGYPRRRILGLLFSETLALVVAGTALGVLLGFLYNRLVLLGLRTIWYDAARLDVVFPAHETKSLVLAIAAGLVLSALVSYLTLSRFLKRGAAAEFAAAGSAQIPPASWKRIASGEKRESPMLSAWRKISSFGAVSVVGIIIAVLGIVLSSVLSAAGFIDATSFFFICGGLALIGFSGAAGLALRRFAQSTSDVRVLTRRRWLFRGLGRRGASSLAVFVLFMAAVFLVVSIGANRPSVDSGAAGTGRFDFVIDLARPFVSRSGAVAPEASLPEGSAVFPLRLRPGDETSCLNLNRVTTPAIIGADAGRLAREQRFAFAQDGTWDWLDAELGEGLIPAAVDQTVLTWSLGLEAGDRLELRDQSGRSFELVLGLVLDDSIFQGSLVISEANYLRLFPDSDGYGRLLVEWPLSGDAALASGEAETTLERLFRSYGPSIERSAERLAEFHSVENAYLTVFFDLGLLSLLLGSAGFLFLAARDLRTRRRELLVLGYIGYPKERIAAAVAAEYAIVVGAGLIAGISAALLAVGPSLAAGSGGGASAFSSPLLALVLSAAALGAILVGLLRFALKEATAKDWGSE